MSVEETVMVIQQKYYWKTRIWNFVNNRKTVPVVTRDPNQCPWYILNAYENFIFTTKFRPSVIEGPYAYRPCHESDGRSPVEFGWEYNIPEEFLPYVTIDFITMPFKVHGKHVHSLIVGVRETFKVPLDIAILWRLSR